jgi:AcrR family transcriptional regulator
MIIHRREFKQQRARKTYESLVAAAAKIFPKRGFEATQVPDIAKAAGVSTGAVYRYFLDKREIFLEMLHLHLRRGRDEVAAQLDPGRLDLADMPKSIRAVVDVIFDQVKKNAELGRVYIAMSLTDRDVAAMRAKAEEEDRDVVATLIETSIARTRIPDAHAAALVVQSATLGAAVECYVLRTAKGREAKIKAALTTAIHRYLFGDAAA